MPVICSVENCGQPAVLKRPKTGHAMCKECFYFAFETEIHVTIIKGQLFKSGYKVAIGASGGKDSTVLAYVLKLLNERYNYGLDLFLLSIDEGITGYRDDSLETVKQNRDDYQLPLKILSYKDLYGWTMDEIVAEIGHKNNCTFCGVFRRQALDRGAAKLGVDMIVTGHNADDMAETIIMNILRGDIARLSRCTHIITEGEGTIPRCKPLKYAYEKEIVMYAHFKKLIYFTTECIYSPNAYRGYTREYIKECERIRPSCILDIIHSGESVTLKESVKLPKRSNCIRCGFIASQEICKACVLLEGLNRGMPKLGIGKSNKAKKVMGLKVDDGSENKTKVKEPRSDSKRKIRRENKKKLSCEKNCSSNCTEKVSELVSIDDVDISSLTIKSNFSEDQQKCKSDENLVFSTLDIFSDDEVDEPVVPKSKKEKIVCKCPPRLKRNLNTSELDDTDSSSSEDIFDMDVFASIVGMNNQLDETEDYIGTRFEVKSQLNELGTKDNKLVEEIMDIISHPSCSKIDFEKLDLQLNEIDNLNDLKSAIKSMQQESTNYLESTDNIESSCSAAEESQESKPKLVDNLDKHLLIDETQHSNSAHVHNLEQLTNESPTIIKAKPRSIRPSLILPEMMHKVKNNLDF